MCPATRTARSARTARRTSTRSTPATPPQFNHAVLLGRIGKDGTPFVIGSETEVTAVNEGRLYLGINDDFFDENAGSFEVVINVS